MSVKNIMEDIVSSTVEEVLKKENDKNNTLEYREDICAFVLNRINPNYVTSERGILHGLLDSRFLLQQKTDILLLIHEAISVIHERRDHEFKHIDLEKETYTYFFPHILGEVVEESTFSKVDDVKVTLLYQGRPVKMMSDGWNNPFLTNSGTMSYYHFWPVLDEEPDPEKEYEFKLVFEHDKMEGKEYLFTVKPVKAVNMSASRSIPIMLLTLKEGVDSSFLYAEE
jgi:competence protein ComFB